MRFVGLKKRNHVQSAIARLQRNKKVLICISEVTRSQIQDPHTNNKRIIK